LPLFGVDILASLNDIVAESVVSTLPCLNVSSGLKPSLWAEKFCVVAVYLLSTLGGIRVVADFNAA